MRTTEYLKLLGVILTDYTFSTCSLFPFLNLGPVSVSAHLKKNENKPPRSYFKQTSLRLSTLLFIPKHKPLASTIKHPNHHWHYTSVVFLNCEQRKSLICKNKTKKNVKQLSLQLGFKWLFKDSILKNLELKWTIYFHASLSTFRKNMSNINFPIVFAAMAANKPRQDLGNPQKISCLRAEWFCCWIHTCEHEFF